MHTRTPDTILEDEGVFTFPSFQSVWRNSIGFPPLFCSSTCCWWCGWRALLTSWSKLAGTPRWLSIESFYPHIVYTQENFTLLAASFFFYIFYFKNRTIQSDNRRRFIKRTTQYWRIHSLRGGDVSLRITHPNSLCRRAGRRLNVWIKKGLPVDAYR